jgi:hypothetical protein
MYGYLLAGALLGTSWLFPNLFWRKKVKNSDVNVIFFHIERDSENPYTDEASVITMYDLRKQLVYTADVSNDDVTSNELGSLVSKILEDHSIPIFVTFDDNGFKRACLKNMLVDIEGLEDVRIMDIKSMFYYTKQDIHSISFDEILEYYNLKPTHTVVDYADIFTHIALDYDPSIMHHLSKVCEMYEELKLLS